MIHLMLYKAKGNLGNALVRWWTKSPYSHCELLVDGVCYSSSLRDGGVRSKTIEVDLNKWDLVEVPWADRYGILAYFELTKGQPYDWLGLLGSMIFNRRVDSPKAAFCSEWCAEALGISCPELYTPGTLADYCREMNELRG